MASEHSYGSTRKNNKTENEAIAYLLKCDSRFIHPDKEGRRRVMEVLGLKKSFSRAFDVLLVKGFTSKDSLAHLTGKEDITLVELKTTKKHLPNNPSGFFFGATENEFKLAKLMGKRYKFCFISLHPESCSHALLSLQDLESRMKTKRVQYQINLAK